MDDLAENVARQPTREPEPTKKENWYSFSWRLAVEIAGVLGLVVGYLGYQAGRQSVDISIASGALDEPELVLSFGNPPLATTGVNEVILGSSIEPDKNVYLARLPLNLRNVGKKTAKDVTLTVRVPKFVQIPRENLRLIKEGTVRTDGVTHEFVDV